MVWRPVQKATRIGRFAGLEASGALAAPGPEFNAGGIQSDRFRALEALAAPGSEFDTQRIGLEPRELQLLRRRLELSGGLWGSRAEKVCIYIKDLNAN